MLQILGSELEDKNLEGGSPDVPEIGPRQAWASTWYMLNGKDRSGKFRYRDPGTKETNLSNQ